MFGSWVLKKLQVGQLGVPSLSHSTRFSVQQLKRRMITYAEKREFRPPFAR